jgi:hypothetical protein
MSTLQTLLALVGLIYVLCVIVQAVQEVLKSLLNTKAKTMEQIIHQFMGSRLPLADVQKALADRGLDITALEHFSRDDFRHLLDGIGSLAPKLQGIVASGTATFEQEKDNVAASFDAARAKFQAAYTRKNKIFAIAFSFAVVIALNANLIAVYEQLAADQVMAQAIAGKADKATCSKNQKQAGMTNPADDFDTIYRTNRDCIANTLKDYPILVRWHEVDGKWRPLDGDGILSTLAGLLVMGGLVSMGAPFWNDILKGFTGLNNTLNNGKKLT